MARVKFKFPNGDAVIIVVDSVPKVDEQVHMEDETSAGHFNEYYYRVSAVRHNILLAESVYYTSIDVILELP
jgi:hypothetical protein